MARPEPKAISARYFWLNVTEGAFFNAGFAFMAPTTLLPLFVASLTSSRFAIGLAGALLMAGLNGVQLFSAWWTRRTPRFWPWFLVSNVLCRITVLPLVLVPLLPFQWRLPGFLVALLLFSMSWGLAAPTWAEYIGRLIPAQRRGEFFGWVGSIKGPATMLATLASAGILAMIPASWNFSACFLLAFLLMSASMACMAFTRYEGQEAVDEVDRTPFFGTLLSKLQANPAFTHYSLLRVLLAGGTLGTSFYVVAGQERFSLTPGGATLLGLALLALPTLTGVWWGRLGDRKGPLAQLLAAILLGVVSNLLLVVPGSLALYVLALMLVGITAGLLIMADYGFIFANCPEERATYFGLFALVQLPPTLGFPLLAGFIADHAGTNAVFWLSAISWGIGGAWLGLKAHGEKRSSKFTPDPSKTLL